MIADGGDALAPLKTLRDQDKLFGAVASDATAWRVVDRVDEPHLDRLRAVRAAARERAWLSGAGPDLVGGLVIDMDATITVAHSEKVGASKRGRRRSAFIRCWPTWTAPTCPVGKPWLGCCARATPGPTPPPTTSPFLRWRWPRCRPMLGPDPASPAPRRC
jgi:hypothetical protein